MKTWNIDTAHSEIAFIVTHMMVSKVRGNFNDFDFECDFDFLRIKLNKIN